MPFQEVNHFMHEDVLQTRYWFLDQLQVQPNSPSLSIAATPPRLHFLDAQFGDRLAYLRLPLREQLRKLFSELSSTPRLQDYIALVSIGSGSHTQLHYPLYVPSVPPGVQ